MSLPDLGGLLAEWGADLPMRGPLAAPLVPLTIFLLRTVDVSLSTIRMLAVVRGRRLVAWVFGFLGSLLFVTATAGVLTGLATGWSLLAYAAGYATGGLLGMAIESRFAPGRTLLRIFTPASAQAVTDALRRTGMGATSYSARQAGGGELVLCYAPRRQASRLCDLVAAVEPECTITSEDVRTVHGGWRV